MSDFNMMNNEKLDKIETEFMLLIQENKDGYYISLENVYNWLEAPEQYKEYCEKVGARRNFRARLLRNGSAALNENNIEDDFIQDFIMRKDDNKIEFPWFSTNGFQAFCMMQNTPKAYLVRTYFIRLQQKYINALSQTSEKNAAALAKHKEDMDKLKEENTSIIAKLINENTELKKENDTLGTKNKLVTAQRDVAKLDTSRIVNHLENMLFEQCRKEADEKGLTPDEAYALFRLRSKEMGVKP
jgi:hypothetical protein